MTSNSSAQARITANKERALVLSGGAEKGAFQVGAVQRLLCDNPDRDYGILTGVSVGAINALYLSQWMDVDGLVEMWLETYNRHVYKSWWFGWLTGFFKGGLYNTAPLTDTLKRYASLETVRESGRRLRVGAVDLELGRYRLFTELDDDLFDGVLASSTHPFVFPPPLVRGHLWTDGGVVNVTPFRSAVEAGATEVDVVMVNPRSGPQRWSPPQDSPHTKANLLQRSLRELELLTDAATHDDIMWCAERNELVRLGSPLAEANGWKTVRVNVYQPRTPLETELMQFDPAVSEQLIKQGFRDAIMPAYIIV